MSNFPTEGPSASQEANFSETIKPYLRRWWWFIVAFFAAIVLSFLYFKVTSPVYNIQSTVLIKDAKRSGGNFASLSDLSGLSSMGTNSIDNEIEILKSKKLMKEVVDRLAIQTAILAKDGLQTKELYKASSPIDIKVVNEKKFSNPILPVEVEIKGDKITLTSENFKYPIINTYKKIISLPYANIIIQKNNQYVADPKFPIKKLSFKYGTVDQTVSAMQKLLTVKLVQRDATIIGLSMNYPEREKAKSIINTLVDVYNLDAIRDKNSESMKTKEFIDDRVTIIAKELGDVEGQKEQFKIANKITDLGTEASLNLNLSANAQAKLVDAETQLQLTGDLLSYLSTQGSNQTLPSNIGISNQTTGSNIIAYNQLILERNNLLETATPNNPVVQDLTKQITILRNSIFDGLKKNRDALLLTRNQIIGEQNKVASKIAKIPSQEKLFRVIERQQQIKESLYLLLLQKREETAIALAVTAPKGRIIDFAYSSEKPVAPKKAMILFLMTFLCLGIPFAYIYLKELFNNKIRSKKDIEKISKTAVIAEIPRLERKGQELVQENDISPMSEAFRILMTNTNYMLPKKEKGSIIFVTSTVKGEGKTFTSVNLALTIAGAKKKVIIIGSDVRNPQLQRYNPSRKGLDGLSEYLYSDDMDKKDIIHQSSFNKNCDVIYSGSIPPNPVQLLANGRYESLIEELRNQYDYIILDTAPLMLVTDSFLFAHLADVTIYVVRSGYTEKSLIDFANKQINNNKIRNVGFVLNDLDKENFGYGNKYGYGYAATEKTFFQKLRDRF